MDVRRLCPQEDVSDLEITVSAYLEIWNHPDNLPFLSFTGQPFLESQIREWCTARGPAGITYSGAFDVGDRLIAVLVSRASRLEGFELVGMGVFPAEKKRGIGRRLVRHALGYAQSQGYIAADAQVFATNVPMLCLLLTEGFIPVRMEHRRGPRGEDLVHLKKQL